VLGNYGTYTDETNITFNGKGTDSQLQIKINVFKQYFGAKIRL